MTWKGFFKLFLILLGILTLDIVSKGMTHFYFKPFEHAPHFFPFGGIAVFQALGIDLVATRDTLAETTFTDPFERAVHHLQQLAIVVALMEEEFLVV